MALISERTLAYWARALAREHGEPLWGVVAELILAVIRQEVPAYGVNIPEAPRKTTDPLLIAKFLRYAVDMSETPAECLPKLHAISITTKDMERWLHGRGVREQQSGEPDVAITDTLAPAPGDTFEAGMTETLDEWIFTQHPAKPGERPKTYKELEQLAGKRGCPDTLKGSDFRAAFRRVYQSKGHRPPKAGWPLRESYRKRLEAEKGAAPRK